MAFSVSNPVKPLGLPLKKITVKAELDGCFLLLKSTIIYRNETTEPIEVLYHYPLGIFHVVGMTLFIDDLKTDIFKAEILTKEQALAAYDDAIASGKSAALGEEISERVFSISLGNLPPQKDAKIYLQLVGEHYIDAEGYINFSLPSTYTSIGMHEDSPTDQIRRCIIPGIHGFELSILNATQIADVTSHTHTLSAVKDADTDKITVSIVEEENLEKDLVIQILHEVPSLPTALVESGLDGNGIMSNPVVMANFFPDFEYITSYCEFLFLVDKSQGMSGSSIEMACGLLKLFMSSLSTGCQFNIIGFGTEIEQLFPDISVPYTKDTSDKAMTYLQDLKAESLCEANLLLCLENIFRTEPRYPRQLIIVTNGCIKNKQLHLCMQRLEENAHTMRCFTFGIGSDCSTAVIEGLAKAGNGVSEFIKDSETMQSKVTQNLNRALQPPVTDATVEFQVNGQYDVIHTPHILPPVYSWEKLVTYAILNPLDPTNIVPIEGTAVLNGKILGNSFSNSIPFVVDPTTDGSTESTLHHLAAISLINDWQIAKKSKDDIIQLSIEAGVLSKYTVFTGETDVSRYKGLSAIVCAQNSDGSWTVQLDGIQKYRDLCPFKLEGNMSIVWTTVVILTLLDIKYASRHDEWEVTQVKALSWLNMQPLPEGLTMSDLLAAAQALFIR